MEEGDGGSLKTKLYLLLKKVNLERLYKCNGLR